MAARHSIYVAVSGAEWVDSESLTVRLIAAGRFVRCQRDTCPWTVRSKLGWIGERGLCCGNGWSLLAACPEGIQLEALHDSFGNFQDDRASGTHEMTRPGIAVV